MMYTFSLEYEMQGDCTRKAINIVFVQYTDYVAFKGTPTVPQRL